MPHVTLPRTPEGLAIPVVIGLKDASATALAAAGQAIPGPILINGILDSGSDITLVAPRVFRQLNLAAVSTVSSQTISGTTSGYLYQVSLIIPPLGNLRQPLLSLDNLEVMELGVSLPNIEAIVGLDVLEHLLQIWDGPRQEFTLSG